MKSIIIALAILLDKFYEMKHPKFQFAFYTLACALLCAFLLPRASAVFAQEPTQTATFSATGITITVLSDEPFANIRLGPSSTTYPKVGRLFPGDTAPALGRSPGGDWIQIEIVSNPNTEFVAAPNNKGWVYSALVQVSAGTLQVVEPPPTPIPPPTATIDPTLAAEFSIQPTTTRLPTFTPPPSLVAPVYPASTPRTESDSVPMAVVILSLGGFFMVSFIGSLFFRRR